MDGPGVELLRRRHFDDLSEVHHCDPVGDVAHHAQVVSHEDVRQAELVLEVVEQVDHLGLDGHVQRGHGLVQHYQLRVDGQGAGDADALALAARELMGEPVGVLRVEPDLVQKLAQAFLVRAACPRSGSGQHR